MFKFDNKWDVDGVAESLNVSLFGKSKKHKALKSTNNGNQSNSITAHDSDDEQYSKNDKKRLKKWRKKNRSDGKTIANDSKNMQQNAGNHVGALSKNNAKENKKNKELSELRLKSNTPPKAGTAVANLKNKTLKQKVKEDSTTTSTETLKEMKSRKRKRSLSDHTDKNIPGNKTKKVKVEENKSSTGSINDVAAPDKEKKKRIRKKKKKNNSKKNKYKHLALNSKTKTADVSTSQVVSQVDESADWSTLKDYDMSEISGLQTVEPSSVKIIKHYRGKIKDNPDFPSKKTVSNNPGLIKQDTNKSNSPGLIKQDTNKSNSPGLIKQDTNRSNNSNPATGELSISEKKSKNRKRTSNHLLNEIDISNNSQPPSNKINKSNNNSQAPSNKINKSNKNSHYETLGNNSQVQPIGEEAGFEKLSPNTSKVSSKNKRKQKILVQVKNGEQVNKQAKADEKRQKNLTLKNKKGNISVVMTVKGDQNVGNGDLTHTDHKIKDNKVKINKEDEQKQEKANKKSAACPATTTAQSIWGKAAGLGLQAKEKLNSARFRYINEQLYSCSGNDALQLFKEDKDAFSVYHDGFQNQTSKWPINPLDVFVKQLRDKPKNLVIADFGCGEAKLAESIPHKVHSFDLVALNDRVTACDMSKTPLAAEQVDIAIFCLSLMGTNIGDYIHEASRVLKTGGLLKIAEVVSRFSGLSRFTDAVCSYGFQLLNKRDVNQMFYLLDFKKIKFVKKSASRLHEIKLKPCIYKKR